jgi:hypothetical protein
MHRHCSPARRRPVPTVDGDGAATIGMRVREDRTEGGAPKSVVDLWRRSLANIQP